MQGRQALCHWATPLSLHPNVNQLAICCMKQVGNSDNFTLEYSVVAHGFENSADIDKSMHKISLT